MIFCVDCKYLWFGRTCNHDNNVKIKNTPLEQERFRKSIDNFNKKNDCKDFKQAQMVIPPGNQG